MMFSLVAPLLAASTPSMYGVSMKSSLVTIDMTSGRMTELGTEHSEELEAQELSAIDAKRGRYYTMGVDTTNQTNTVVMVVWNLADGKISKKVALPFAGEPFVGIGEAIDVALECQHFALFPEGGADPRALGGRARGEGRRPASSSRPGCAGR